MHDRLALRSSGNFLYAKSVLTSLSQALSSGDEQALLRYSDLNLIPETLPSLYSYFLSHALTWIEQKLGPNAWQRYLGPTLAVLSAAGEPLGFGTLSAVTNLPPTEMATIIDQIRQFLTLSIDGEERYHFHHSSLVDFLVSSNSVHAFKVDILKGHELLSRFYVDFWGQTEKAFPDLWRVEISDPKQSYGIRHIVSHLIELKQYEVAAAVLTAPSFLERWSSIGRAQDMLTMLTEVHKHLAENDANRGTLELLEAALKRDLAFLTRHPGCLFQCLWNSCWWVGVTNRRTHYDVSQKLPWRFGPVRPHGVTVSRLMERWKDGRSNSRLDRPWVKSLRPPEVGIGSALIATVRGDGQAATALHFGQGGNNIVLETTRLRALDMADAVADRVVVLDANSGVQIACFSGECAQLLRAEPQTYIGVAEGSEIRIVYAGNNETVSVLKHSGAVQRFWSAPDGRHLVSLAEDSAQLWDISDLQRPTIIYVWPPSGWRIQFSPDSAHIVTTKRGFSFFGREVELAVWDANTGAELLSGITGDVNSVSSPTRARVAVFSSGGLFKGTNSVVVYDLMQSSPPVTLSKPGIRLQDFRFSSDGRQLIATGERLFGLVDVLASNLPLPFIRRFIRWDLEKGEGLKPIRTLFTPISTIATSTKELLLAAGSTTGSIGVWDLVRGKRKFIDRLSDQPIKILFFLPVGRSVICASDRTIAIAKLDSRRFLKFFQPEIDISHVAVSENGSKLASAASDGSVRIWKVGGNSDHSVLKGHHEQVCRTSLVPDKRQMFSADARELHLWDMDTGLQLATFRGKGQWLRHWACSADGRWLATAERGDLVRIWRAHSGRLSAVLGVESDIAAVAFSGDGQWLASLSDDTGSEAVINIWNLPKISGGRKVGRVRRELKPTRRAKIGGRCSKLAFSPDSSCIATAFFSSLKVYRTVDASEALLLRGNGLDQTNVFAFSPDGAYLVSGHGDPYSDSGPPYGHASRNSVCIWSLENGRLVAELLGHRDVVTAVAVSQDGSQIVSGSRDGSVLVWSLQDHSKIIALSDLTSSIREVFFDDRIIARSDRDFVAWNSTNYTVDVRVSSTSHQAEISFGTSGLDSLWYSEPLWHPLCEFSAGIRLGAARSNHISLLRVEDCLRESTLTINHDDRMDNPTKVSLKGIGKHRNIFTRAYEWMFKRTNDPCK